jgi:hypothetical protein
MWCAAETVAKAHGVRDSLACWERTHGAAIRRLRSPGVSSADGQGKKGLEEQDDDMFGLTRMAT